MAKKPGPQRAPMAVRLTEEMDRRFSECATRIKQSKHALAIEAIEAAVEAIENNGYRIVVPIQFQVTHVPVDTSAKTEALSARGEKPAVAAGGRSSGSTVKRPLYSVNEVGDPPAPRITTDPPAV